MGCCVPYQYVFANAAFTDIPYTDDMKAKLGSAPKIEVFYFDPATNSYYAISGLPGTERKFDGTTISVDHGGLATGIIKVS